LGWGESIKPAVASDKKGLTELPITCHFARFT